MKTFLLCMTVESKEIMCQDCEDIGSVILCQMEEWKLRYYLSILLFGYQIVNNNYFKLGSSHVLKK